MSDIISSIFRVLRAIGNDRRRLRKRNDKNKYKGKNLSEVAEEMSLDEKTTERYLLFLSELYGSYYYDEEQEDYYINITQNDAYKWASKFRKGSEYINANKIQLKILSRIDSKRGEIGKKWRKLYYMHHNQIRKS